MKLYEKLSPFPYFEKYGFLKNLMGLFEEVGLGLQNRGTIISHIVSMLFRDGSSKRL